MYASLEKFCAALLCAKLVIVVSYPTGYQIIVKIILTLPPSYADRQPIPHLGLACLSAFLAQRGVQADILDLNIESWGNWYDPLTLTADRLYVDELLDLPLVSILVQGFRRGNMGKQLVDKNSYKEILLKYALDFGIPAERLLSRIHCLNVLAIAFSQKLLPYDLVCFTLYRSNFYSTVLLALLLREQKPQIRVVIGGPQVSQSELTCQFLLQFGITDAIIKGEGEETLWAFIQAIKRGEDYRPIPGVMTYHPSQTFSYTPRKQADNLDHLPTPDFYRFNLSKYTPFSLPVYASRGCPYSCSYCAQQPIFSPMRYRSVAKVIDDLKLLQHQYRSGFFRFADSLVNSSYARLEELADRLISQKLGIVWQAYFRANITNSLAQKLKQAGLEFVTIGVESLADQVLGRMNKRCSQTDNLQAIATFLSAGISVKINLIVAHPGESQEGYFETLHHCERLLEEYSPKKDYPTLNVSVYPFHVTPGSLVYHRPADFGLSLHYGNSLTEQMLDDDLAEFMGKVPTTFSIAELTSGEAFKRFQALDQLAAKTNSLLTSVSLKRLIGNLLQPKDQLFLADKPIGRIELGERTPPISFYLPIEKTVIQIHPFAQTIFNTLNSASGLSVGNLCQKVGLAHPEVQQVEILNMLAVLIHNQIIQLSPA